MKKELTELQLAVLKRALSLLAHEDHLGKLNEGDVEQIATDAFIDAGIEWDPTRVFPPAYDLAKRRTQTHECES